MKQHSNQPPQPTRTRTQFDVLIGDWDMVGTHPMIPFPVKGRSSFEWLREGALLAWHFNWEQGPGIPNAYSIIGHDDSVEPCSVLYTDERGVSRIYQMTLDGGIWKMWRNSPDFSQRMNGTFSNDRNTVTVRGELSHDGSSWEQDLNITYTRKK